MRLSRPVIVALTAGAVLILVGRTVAFLYAEQSWYTALGASAVWRERVLDVVLVQLVTLTIGAGFAFANLSAVRHSILALLLPRRLANVEFTEAVPSRRLDAAAVVASLAITLAAASFAPQWTTLALARSGVRFGEIEPYRQLDLGFYVAWLPLEMELHRWAWMLVATVAITVVALYSLTPGLGVVDGHLKVSSYVRRHLGVLAGVILLMVAWRFRIRSYALLFDGTGPDSAFTAIDHQWLIPAYVVASIAMVAAAAVVAWSAGARQPAITLAAVVGAVVVAVSAQQVVPVIASSAKGTDSAADSGYAATRDAFTHRAFDESRASAGRAPTTPRAAETLRLANFAPDARGYLVVSDSAGIMPAPSLASMWSRIANAWKEQDARLLGSDIPAAPRILRVRDVVARVRRLVPVFDVSPRADAVFRADTVYWRVRVHASSRTYPLSLARTMEGERVAYFRTAATAYVNGITGATTIVATATPDAVTRAWIRRTPAVVRGPAAAPGWIVELSSEPTAPVPQVGPGAMDPVFRARVRDLYLRMQRALAESDLVTFGVAFDSLGALLGRQRDTTGVAAPSLR